MLVRFPCQLRIVWSQAVERVKHTTRRTVRAWFTRVIAGLLAVRMLGIEDLNLRRKMQEFMRRQETEVRVNSSRVELPASFVIVAAVTKMFI